MISVAMATYNGEKYIMTQVKSILKNLNPEDELVISDDGSTDRTIKIVESLNDKRIKIFKGPGKGVSKNFENAICHCKGDIIFLSDQDDIWAKGKVSKVLKAFEDEKCVVVLHDAIVVDETNTIIKPSYYKYRFRKVYTSTFLNLIKSTYFGCCMAFRPVSKSKIFPIPKGCLHDRWIGLILSISGKTVYIDEPLIKYRRHGDNVSSFDKPNSIDKQIVERARMAFWLIKRGIFG